MNEKTNTMPERIMEMYKYAIAAGKASSKQSFAELAGITREVLSRYLNGKAEPSRKTLALLNSALGNPFNEDWLLTGSGEPLAVDKVRSIQKDGNAIEMLITEMRESRIAKDEQIARLLCIIEKMQDK